MLRFLSLEVGQNFTKITGIFRKRKAVSLGEKAIVWAIDGPRTLGRPQKPGPRPSFSRNRPGLSSDTGSLTTQVNFGMSE